MDLFFSNEIFSHTQIELKENLKKVWDNQKFLTKKDIETLRQLGLKGVDKTTGNLK